jgi:hypothetical protein
VGLSIPSTPKATLKRTPYGDNSLKHVEDPSHLMRVLEEKSKRTESIFEREVLKRLVLAGYRVTAQWG